MRVVSTFCAMALVSFFGLLSFLATTFCVSFATVVGVFAFLATVFSCFAGVFALAIVLVAYFFLSIVIGGVLGLCESGFSSLYA